MSDSASKFEVSDVRVRPLINFGLILAVLVLATYGLASWMLDSFAGSEIQADQEHPMKRYRREPAGPRLQANPNQDSDAKRAFENSSLGGYGWIDVQAGVVRIPIERAMELVAEEGLPHRPTAGNPDQGAGPR